MTEHIRIRCQILKTIAAIGPCDISQVNDELPHLSRLQVRKTCGRLMHQDDEIKVVGTNPNKGGGVPLNIYEVRGENETRNKKPDPRVGKRKRPNHKDKLKEPMRIDKNKMRIMINFRERKMKLLESLMKHVSDTQKDLLIGIINDYKH